MTHCSDFKALSPLKRRFQEIKLIFRVRTLKLCEFRKKFVADFLADDSLSSKNAKNYCIIFTRNNHWFGINLTTPFICSLRNNRPQLPDLNCLIFICPTTPFSLTAVHNFPILPCCKDPKVCIIFLKIM